MKYNFLFSLLIIFVFNKIHCQEIKSTPYRNLLFLKGFAGTNALGFGGKYSGDYTLSKYQKYAIGVNLSGEKITKYYNDIIPNTNTSSTIVLATIGYHGTYQINSQFFVQAEFSFLAGKQTIDKLVATTQNIPGTHLVQVGPYSYMTANTTTVYHTEVTEKTIYGGHFEQHLFYQPKNAKPLIIGISIFERFLNANYYENDIGIAFNLGLKI